MSDTPDTDQKAVPHIGFYSCATVPAEFARKLERERDEAREQNVKVRDIADTAIEYVGHTSVQQKLRAELKQELDEAQAREELHDIRLNLGADAEGYTLVHAVCVLQQERDEAREAADRFRSLYYSNLGINGSASWFPWEGKLNE
jgi:hypothetical protein